MMRRVPAFVLVALVGCSFSRAPADGQAPPTPEAVRVGEPLEAFTPPDPTQHPEAETAATPTTTGFDITLVDHNGMHPAGIPVEISDVGVLLSDEAGRVAMEVDPGRYTARVLAGCHDTVTVSWAGTDAAADFGPRHACR